MSRAARKRNIRGRSNNSWNDLPQCSSTTSIVGRRRQSLLASTALVGAILAGVTLMPNRVMAANECGAIPAGPNSTVTCSGTFANGIEYKPASGNSVFTVNAGNGTIGGLATVSAPTIAGFGQFGIVVGGGGLFPTILTIPTAGAPSSVVVNVNAFSNVQGTGGGVLVWTTGAGHDSTVNNYATVSTPGTGTLATGIGLNAVSNNGNSNVTNFVNGSVNSLNNSINGFALAGTSTVTLENDGSLTSTNKDGISTVDPVFGIAPTFGAGLATNNGSIDAGRNGINLFAAGTATVNLGATSVINAGSFATGAGVYTVSATGNAIVNGNAASQTNSTSGPGIVGASLLGTSTVDAGIVTSGAGVVTIAGFAIPAIPGLPTVSGGVISLAGGDAVANAHGNITTTGNFGVLALSLGGNATAHSDAGITIDPPIGMASITAGAFTSTVNNNATLNTTLVGLLGINLGNGAVHITNSTTGDVEAATGAGAVAIKIGAGNGVTIGGNSVVISNDNTGGGLGGVINAPAGPGVFVLAFDPAFTNPNNVLITNGNLASITGGGGLLTAAIDAVADGSVTINNNTGSTINNATGLGAGDASGLSVLTISGANNTLNNAGATVSGQVSMTSFLGASTVNNTAGALWSSQGLLNLVFSNGDATINNNTGGVILNPALTLTLVSSLNGNATLNNGNDGLGGVDGTGRVQIGTALSPTAATYVFLAPNGIEQVVNNATNPNSNGRCETLNGICVNGAGVFTGTTAGLEFNNAGGVLSMINGTSNYGLVVTPGFNTGLGDLTTINGNFNGTGKSQLGLDAFLSGPNNSSSDLMLVTNVGVAGRVTGATGIIVANGNNPGQYNTVGIPVVAVASGLTTFNNFYIDPQSNNYATKNGVGVVDKGLFFYAHELVPSKNLPVPALTHILVGLPDDEAFQLAYVGAGAQNIWYETANGWVDKQNDLRNNMMRQAAMAKAAGAGADLPVKARPPVAAPAGSGVGVWLKAIGSWTSRSDHQATGILGFGFDTGYKQDTYGFLGGVDWTRTSQFDTAQVGLMAGYVDSKLKFDSSTAPTRFNYHGGLVGATGTYMNRGWFIDGLVKADFLTLDINMPSIAAFGQSDFGGINVTSIGVMGNFGYRFAFGASYLEPIATLAYVSTKIDDFLLQNQSVNFDDAKSFRGGAGARLGTVVPMYGKIVDASLTGRVWNEWEGKNSVTLSSGSSPDLTLTDGAMKNKPFGDVSGLINVANPGNGWSGFVNLGVKFNEDFTTTTAKGGVRYAW